ncbi:MAG TPA: hypothetical protein VNT55_05000 [Baekduia sp.]|nr:hypothetical protein [Baekduia sp.]
MPQPKKPASSARKPAARGAAAKRTRSGAGGTPAKNAAARSAATKLNAPRRRATAAKPAPAPPTPDDAVATLGALRERLVSSLTLTSERLQEAVDDAVRRGRMTRKDAEELLGTLVAAGRAQTEAILADVEQLLGRGGGVRVRAKADATGDVVLRTVDRARRRVGVGSFPILGYEDLTAAQITRRLADLTPAQLRKVRDHERRHDARKSVLAAIERKLG